MFSFESQGAVELLAPEVALNHENAEQLYRAMTERVFAGQPMVVLDMSHVPLVDSAGLETLLDVQQTLRESAGALKLAGLSPLCQDVFLATGLSERFETYADSKAAVGSFVR